jgi:hypothetical protein
MSCVAHVESSQRPNLGKLSHLCFGKRLMHSQAAGSKKAQPSSWRPTPARTAILRFPVRAYANTCSRVATKYLCLGHAETLSRVIRLNRISLARLAQSAERKALNLVVVGSSPTVGVLCGTQFGILEQGE